MISGGLLSTLWFLATWPSINSENGDLDDGAGGLQMSMAKTRSRLGNVRQNFFSVKNFHTGDHSWTTEQKNFIDRYIV